MNFIVRWLITALAVAFTVWLVQYGREAYSPSAKPAYHSAHIWPVLSGREYGNAVLGIGYLGWTVRR